LYVENFGAAIIVHPEKFQKVATGLEFWFGFQIKTGVSKLFCSWATYTISITL